MLLGSSRSCGCEYDVVASLDVRPGWYEVGRECEAPAAVASFRRCKCSQGSAGEGVLATGTRLESMKQLPCRDGATCCFLSPAFPVTTLRPPGRWSGAKGFVVLCALLPV
jgi:hypothetical protein